MPPQNWKKFFRPGLKKPLTGITLTCSYCSLTAKIFTVPRQVAGCRVLLCRRPTIIFALYFCPR